MVEPTSNGAEAPFFGGRGWMSGQCLGTKVLTPRPVPSQRRPHVSTSDFELVVCMDANDRGSDYPRGFEQSVGFVVRTDTYLPSFLIGNMLNTFFLHVISMHSTVLLVVWLPRTNPLYAEYGEV